MSIDFVFIDGTNTPYRVRQSANIYWLHFMNKNNKWESLRPLGRIELAHMMERKLPQSQANAYEFGVPFLKDNKTELGMLTFGGVC